MFCSACGAPIQPEFSICPNCHRAVPSVVAVPAATVTLPGRLDRHLRVLGTLWVIAGALFLIPGFVLMMLSGVVHVAIPVAEAIPRTVAPLVLSMIGGSLFIVATGGMLVGWGLLKHLPWARVAAIVLGIVSLLHPPYGMALGIYTLWVLLSDQADKKYDQLASAA